MNWVEGKVVGKKQWTDNLYTLYIDAPIEPFRAGQFTQLAMDVDGERIARPYSLVNAPEQRPLEFHFVTIPGGPLTDRLRALASGDSIEVQARPAGNFTLAGVPDARHLWLLATGTAIGVFISLLRTSEPWSRFEKIVLAQAARTASELSYRDEIEEMAARHPGQLIHIPYVSREDTDFAIRDRIPATLSDGRLEERAGLRIDPAVSQVMICGNPGMVRDCIRILEERGLRRNKRSEPGHITTEHYW
jgi:ferredoxin--NADP+ reductase